MKLAPWLQRLADECTDEDMAQLNKTLEEPVMTEPVPMFPDHNPHAEQFIADLQSVLDDHQGRGHMSYAEVLGILEIAKQRVLLDFEERD